jgi:dTDP-4-amino-4,6-dideoxygalactose transaminase
VLSFNSDKVFAGGEGGAIVTDSDELFESLVIQTQHPLRQKRQIGLLRTNHFCLNMRMHPETARLIVSRWNKYQTRARARTDCGSRIIHQFSKAGVAEFPRYLRGGIKPVFSHLMIARRSGASIGRVISAGREIDPTIRVLPHGLVPLYAQPGFPRSAIAGVIDTPVLEFELGRQHRLVNWDRSSTMGGHSTIQPRKRERSFVR